MKKTMRKRGLNIRPQDDSKQLKNRITRAVLKNGGYLQIKNDGCFVKYIVMSCNNENFRNSLQAVREVYKKHFGKNTICF